MKQKLLNLFLFLTISITSFAQVANQPNDYVVCDEDNDGFAQFDLAFLDAEVLGSQNPVDYTITYYASQSDAESSTNALSLPFANFVPWQQTIYIRLEDNNTGNFDTTTVNLIVNPIPYAVQPTALSVCDDSLDDEIAVFNLTVKNAEITNGNDDWSVAYYETSADAQTQMNAIATIYSNTTNPQTLYVAITDLTTGCVGSTALTIRVLPNPSGAMGTANDIILCDDDNDGIAMFDLTINESAINPYGELFTLSYFSNEADALGNVSPIGNLTNFTNSSNPQTIYARVETFDGCSALTDFVISVNPLPEIYLESSYSFCTGSTLVLETGLSVFDYYFEWNLNGNTIQGANLPSLTVTEPGEYDVVLYSSDFGCSSSTYIIVEEVSCTDSDDDGVIDSNEDINGNGNLEDDDTDGDNIPNYLDSDDDGDNVATIDEINIVLGRSNNTIQQFVDTDEDEIENYLDDDDDGDGILTIDEDYNNNGDPTDDDTNFNGVPDYLESSVALSVNQFNSVEFHLYPNPAKEVVTITLNNTLNETLQIRVYDVQGKDVNVFQNTIGNLINLNTSHLSSGLYFVELQNGAIKNIQKLIKE